MTVSVGVIIAVVIIVLFAIYGRASTVFGDFGRLFCLVLGIWVTPKLVDWLIKTVNGWTSQQKAPFGIKEVFPKEARPILPLVLVAVVVFLTYFVFIPKGKGTKPAPLGVRTLSMAIAATSGFVVARYFYTTIDSMINIPKNQQNVPINIPTITVDNSFRLPFADWPSQVPLILVGVFLLFCLLAAPPTDVTLINRKVEVTKLGRVFLGIVGAFVVFLLIINS